MQFQNKIIRFYLGTLPAPIIDGSTTWLLVEYCFFFFIYLFFFFIIIIFFLFFFFAKNIIKIAITLLKKSNFLFLSNIILICTNLLFTIPPSVKKSFHDKTTSASKLQTDQHAQMLTHSLRNKKKKKKQEKKKKKKKNIFILIRLSLLL